MQSGISVVGIFVLGFNIFLTNASANYQGHGEKSVSSEVIAKFSPPALDERLAAKIQAFQDIRSPAMGIASADGKQLFFTWTVTGTPQVWRLDGPLKFPVQMTGGNESTQIAGLTPDGRYLLIARDKNGAENPGLYLQSTKGGELKVIRHQEGIRVSLNYISGDSKHIYFRANDVRPDSYTIYRHEISTEKTEKVFDEIGIWSIADVWKDQLFLLRKSTGSLTSEYYEWDLTSRSLTPIIGQNELEEYEVQFAAQRGQYLVLTSKLGEFRRLYRLEPHKPLVPITRDLKSDIESFSLDQARIRIIYSINDKGYARVEVKDAKTYGDLKFPKLGISEQIHVGATTRNGRYTSLGVETSQFPRQSYVYDWKTQKLTQWLIPSTPEVDTMRFSKSTLEYYPSRDGVQIPMFVRRPQECQSKTCPVVVHFHGGPEAQTTPGFSIYAQLFLDEGFIFVEPNVRGSDGYGKTWLRSDDGPKRLDVAADIEDCATYIKSNWNHGGENPKVGIMGWSYGGYSTLLGMTKFAGAYDAGVALVGISNLITFLKNTAPYRRALRISEYGDPDKDKDALEKLSPINYLDRMKAPLLIVQGANDPRVPVGEALQIHEALQKKKVSSQLIVFGDEGHGSAKRENQVLEIGHTLLFFIKHLKSKPAL